MLLLHNNKHILVGTVSTVILQIVITKFNQVNIVQFPFQPLTQLTTIFALLVTIVRWRG